jgi:NADPH-dependent glutamate synthase beta subunit-like oxidoreductase
MRTQEFLDDGKGHVKGIKTVQVAWTKDDTGRWKMDEVPDSEKVRLNLILFVTIKQCIISFFTKN